MPCIGNVPSIVASDSISKPSGGIISSTTIFTPSGLGLFRVSLYGDGPGPNGTHISWTDSGGTAANVGVPGSNPWQTSGGDGNGSFWFTVMIYTGANPIQIYSTTSVAGPYTVYYIVEQLA